MSNTCTGVAHVNSSATPRVSLHSSDRAAGRGGTAWRQDPPSWGGTGQQNPSGPARAWEGATTRWGPAPAQRSAPEAVQMLLRGTKQEAADGTKPTRTPLRREPELAAPRQGHAHDPPWTSERRTTSFHWAALQQARRCPSFQDFHLPRPSPAQTTGAVLQVWPRGEVVPTEAIC